MENIGIINPRNKINDDTVVSFMPMTQLAAGYGSQYDLSERTWLSVKSGFTHFAENDVVFAKITPCFQNRKSAVMRGLKNGYGAGTTELHVIRCLSGVIPEYILKGIGLLFHNYSENHNPRHAFTEIMRSSLSCSSLNIKQQEEEPSTRPSPRKPQ